MSLILDGTNGLTFNNASTQASAGLPLTGGTLSGALTVPTLNAPSGVLATQNGMNGIAKAWVQFTCPTGTVTINGSFNISSVTRTASGVYQIVFTTAMTNGNYSAVASASNVNNNSTVGFVQTFVSSGSDAAPTSSGFYVQGRGVSGATYDADYVCIAVFS